MHRAPLREDGRHDTRAERVRRRDAQQTGQALLVNHELAADGLDLLLDTLCAREQLLAGG